MDPRGFYSVTMPAPSSAKVCPFQMDLQVEGGLWGALPQARTGLKHRARQAHVVLLTAHDKIMLPGRDHHAHHELKLAMISSSPLTSCLPHLKLTRIDRSLTI
eukprot:1136208-Pelagomonas_calceolata.AAC.2